jgi:ABC-type Na+ efflux pump permease subunit
VCCITVHIAATPRIAVTFDVNTNGDLKVQAVELVSEGGKMEEETKTVETETEETETAMEVTAEEVTVDTEGVQPVPPEQVEEPSSMEGNSIYFNSLMPIIFVITVVQTSSCCSTCSVSTNMCYYVHK